jgi:membrane protein
MSRWLLKRAWPPVLETLQGWSKDDGAMLSAAMAYYAAFSLFPLCLVLIAILGVVTRLTSNSLDPQSQMLKLVGENVDPWLVRQLGDLLSGVQSRAGVGGPIGLLTLAIGAIAIFVQLEAMFDRIWRLPDSGPKGWVAAIREVVWGRVVAFLMLLGVGALLLMLFLAGLLPSDLKVHVLGLPFGKYLWQVCQIVLTVAGYTLLLGMIYKIIPKAKVPWKAALSGGLLVAVVWQIGQQALAFFLIGDKYSAYGVVGSFIALMIWFYYASAVMFMGAEFTAAICRRIVK